MAATYKDNGGSVNGSNKVFTYDFPVLQTEDIKVALNGVTQATTKYTASLSPANITFNNTSVDSSVQESDGSPKSGVTVRVYRETTVGKNTGDEDPKAVFAAGSSIRAGDLNANVEQALFGIHELQEQPIQTESIADDAVTSAKLDTNIDIAGTLDVTGATTLDSTLSVASNATVGGTLGVTGVTTLSDDVNISSADINFKVKNGSTDKFTVKSASGNTTIAGTLAAGATTVTGNITVSGTVDGRDVAADGSKLDNIESGATADQTLSDISSLGAATLTGSETLTNKTLTSPVINDMSGTAVVTSGTSTSDTKTYSAKRAGELFYGKGTADDIEASGVPWSGNDSTVATTAAIDKRIVDIVDDVGGFVALTDEGDIPQYHPEKENTDTADRIGTILSIGTLTTTYTPSTGTCTIAASTLDNHSVNATITDCGSTVLSSGFGVLVETKAQTDGQYAAGPSFKFHRLVPKATEVTTVSGSISNVNTVAGAISNVNAVASNATNINAVAADATDIGAVAAKATEIGRLGTSDAVADLALLGTTAVVEDLNLLGTSAAVADMALLGDSAVIADMATIADTSNLISNIGTVAGAATNVNNVGGSIANVNTVAGNLSGVNSFGERYRTPQNNAGEYSSSNDVGDLYFNTSINALKVWNGSAWVAGVTAAGDYAVTTGDTFTGNVKLNDSVELRVGTGDDLKVWHSSDVNNISSTNGKIVLATTAGNSDIEVTPHGSGVVKLDGLSWPTADGSANQYLKTNGSGALSWATVDLSTFTADVTFDNQSNAGRDIIWDESDDSLEFQDNTKATFGTGNDLQIYHNGSHSFIQSLTGFLIIDSDALSMRSKTNGEAYITGTHNGSVDLYYDNSKKFETTSDGIKVTGQVQVSDYIETFTDDTDLKINASGSSGQIKFYINGSEKAKIDSSGNFSINNDSGKITAGLSADLQIYHDGSNSYLTNSTGALYVRTGTGFNVQNAGGTETYLYATENGGVFLKYDNSTKFQTESWGTQVTSGQLYIASGCSFKVADSTQIQVGDSADLIIYSNNSHSFLTNSTGNLYIGGANGHDGNIVIQATYGEESIIADHDGAVKLYYDNSKKIETLSDGARIYGHLKMNDNEDIRLGTGGDLKLYHDGSNSYIKDEGTGDLYIRNGSDNSIKCQTNDEVVLYFDGTQKLATSSTGIWVSGALSGESVDLADSKKILLGSGDDLELYHDGSNSYIDDSGTGFLILRSNQFQVKNIDQDEKIIVGDANGQVELYYDDSLKFNINSAGANVTGRLYTSTYVDAQQGIYITDGYKAHFGNQSDLQIKHTGSNAEILNQTGTQYYASAQHHFYNVAYDELQAKFIENGAVELYHNNIKRVETSSSGVTITGDLTVTGSAPGVPALGGAKAWVNWNGTGTPSIRSSYNVASITDNAYARHTVNIDSDFSNANYCTVSHAGNSGGGGRTMCQNNSPSAGAYSFQMLNLGNNYEEFYECCAAFFGS